MNRHNYPGCEIVKTSLTIADHNRMRHQIGDPIITEPEGPRSSASVIRQLFIDVLYYGKDSQKNGRRNRLPHQAEPLLVVQVELQYDLLRHFQRFAI